MASSSSKLLVDKHVAYIQALAKNKDDLAYHLTTHLRLNAIYWGITALHILGRTDALDRNDVVDFVMSCWDDEAGAFGANPGHDAHVLGTLSGIQILVTYDALDRLDVDGKRTRVVDFLLSLRNDDGSFSGDAFGERDTRFLYCAVSALSLLGEREHLARIADPAVAHIQRCRNFDGGFGTDPGAESHSGQVWVCVSALAILDQLNEQTVDIPLLAWWLAERQLPSGGLNGRPEKLPDVCYSHWVLSSLAVLRRVSWIDGPLLERFILAAQDEEGGGLADRAGDMVDVFHTLFGITGLSLLGYPGLEDLDPVYCMPASVIEARGLRKDWLALPRRSA
ncbi:rab geranylgeranyltransferase [Auricularia subglabra TFB-10046 SS5]|uniref:Geranylgeranyl transferase type-2 subunit beta n=1 Tax=Auricularia subglabra (strain TFB-10046 / SS5) TaxID=717982 RepID=J0D8K2_AURST|nr:rab geranylgeranyltransferase [Auricularia subglabra TFB-10046 SS5]